MEGLIGAFVWFLLLQAGIVVGLNIQKNSLNPFLIKGRSSPRVITYRSIEVPVAKKKGDTSQVEQLLVDQEKTNVIEELQALLSSTKQVRSVSIEKLLENEGVFRSNDFEGISLYEERCRAKYIESTVVRQKPKTQYSSVDSYINLGTEAAPYLIHRRHVPANIAHYSAKARKELRSRFLGFSNMTELFQAERQLRRLESIPEKLEEMYPLYSRQWGHYVKKVAEYQMSTLSHIVIQYFHTVDNNAMGSKRKRQYERKPGYLGTLAPPADDSMASSASQLPKRVLTPWPVVQELPMYFRLPVPHPRTPSVLLMMARNGQFADGVVAATQEGALGPGTLRDPIFAGQAMEPRDVVRIARHVEEGACFDPAIQLPHVGLMAWEHEHDPLPFYRPDHGPTIPKEQLEHDLPGSFLAKLNPDHDFTVPGAKDHVISIPQHDIDESKEEEYWRQQRVKGIKMHMMDNSPWAQKEKRNTADVVANVEKKIDFLAEEYYRKREMTSELLHDLIASVPAEEVLAESKSSAGTVGGKDPFDAYFESLVEIVMGERGGPTAMSSSDKSKTSEDSQHRSHIPVPSPMFDKNGRLPQLSFEDLMQGKAPNPLDVMEAMDPVLAHLLPAEFNPMTQAYDDFSTQYYLNSCNVTPDHPVVQAIEIMDQAEKASGPDQPVCLPHIERRLIHRQPDTVVCEETLIRQTHLQLVGLLNQTNDVFTYYDQIRDIVRGAIQKRFPTIYGRGYNDFANFLSTMLPLDSYDLSGKESDAAAEAAGMIEHVNYQRTSSDPSVFRTPKPRAKAVPRAVHNVPASAKGTFRGIPLESLSQMSDMVYGFIEELSVVAQEVADLKFRQYLEKGHRTFRRNHHSLDPRTLHRPRVRVLDPELQVSDVFEMRNEERTFVVQQRDKFIDNELKMLAIREAVFDGVDRRTEAQRIRYAVDMANKIQTFVTQTEAEDEFQEEIFGKEIGNLGKTKKSAPDSSASAE